MVKLASTVGESIKATNPVDTFTSVRDSKDTVLERFRLVLVGPPKEGKTFCAATASEHYPESLPAKEMTNLADMFWCQLDNGGLDGFAEQNLSAPHMDLSNVPAPYLIQALQKFQEIAAERVAAGVTKTVVYDSLTALDKLLLAHLMKDYEKWGLYQAILAKHLQVFQQAKSLQCNVIFVCHGKAVTLPDTPEAQVKQVASGVTPGTIEMDLSGQVSNFYRQSMSLILPVAEKAAGEYVICPKGFKGFAGYSRFANLAREEPAHLGKLFAKIRANQPH
jgi:hypothetical protein